MKTIQVVALADFDLGDDPVAAGEVRDVSAVDAARLIYRSKARHAKSSDRMVDEAPRPRRRYRRKDLVAE